MLLCDGYAIMGQIENSLLFYIVDIGLRSLTFWVLRKPNEDNQYQGFAIVKKCCASFSHIRFLDERVCNEVWYSSHTNGSLYFKQWDPGGCCLVNWVSLLDWRSIGWILLFSNNCLSFNLEDKVDFKGEGNVMNLPYWIDPIMNDSTWAQEIEYQGMSWHI
jgi:hypothetical protein